MARPEIAALDRALEADGETVTVRRRIDTSGSFVELTVRGRLSGYVGVEMHGGIELQDSKIIMSPSTFDAVTWPGAAGGEKYLTRGDFIVNQGRTRHVEQAVPITVGDVVVRIEARIR